MYCSGCGHALDAGQSFCSQCGRPAAAAGATYRPGPEFLLQSYAGKLRTLSIVWFAYAAFSLCAGIASLAFANAFLLGHFSPWAQGPWMDGPMPWMGFMPMLLRFGWAFLILRTGLAIAAAWGLLEHAPWGRIVAILASIFCLLKFPFGTALGIWTLIMLLGNRNAALYEQL
jgi:hypothetical protein